MPVNVSFPGVYIHEVKSRVRTITGVPTSVAAFVGSAPRGPVDTPVHVIGWADYEAWFGGLDANSAMGHAVYQFFLNGGTDAEVVRVLPDSVRLAEVRVGKDTTPGGQDGRPKLKAASPGAWGRKLRVRVDYDGIPKADSGLYNLTIRDAGTGVQERYTNIKAGSNGPRGLTKMLSGSRLVVAEGDGGPERPPEHDTPEHFSGDLLADPPVPHPGEAHGDAEGEPGEGEVPGDTAVLFEKPDQGGGTDAEPTKDDYRGSPAGQTGIHALLKTDIFNLLCLPGAPAEVLPEALQLCVERRAILLVDPPDEWKDKDASEVAKTALETPLLPVESGKNAALYFPEIRAVDPLDGETKAFPPCGVMAGVLARTDAQRGVWKAPAGTDASLAGVTGLTTVLTDRENGLLNPLGVNCLRQLPLVGPVAWGARTLRGADRFADEWKYLPVRRLALFVEESLFRGTQWVVFEPNDEPLWSSIRLNVGAFMNSLFREGAFQGRTPDEAYLVKCDRENNPQNDIDRGIVNIQVGFAPLKPAEFVIIHIEQLAGQIQA
ncbi:phage tail sheath C-terminal domain-containing protein [Streptomyces sp. NPDC002553]|uniref:phage tail sheath family protein n=1 Tax=Streptomyces sp. NPDC002553 TaxID=3154417 RepID=UPI00331B0686